MRKPLITRRPRLRQYSGDLLAVELDPVQAHPGRQVLHHRGRFIHEDPDARPRRAAVGR